MTTTKIYPWLLRLLAAVGSIAIVILILTSLSRLLSQRPFDVSDSYYEEMEAIKMVASDSSMQRSLVMESPELLSDETIDVDQKVIKTGTLELIVLDVEKSARAVKSIVEEKGGHVQSSLVEELADGTLSGYVIARVPVDQFESSMETLKTEALVVKEESTFSEDVTEQYIDLAARLKNAKVQETRYVEILDIAQTVEEILQIENALAEVRGYIESLTGQIQYLESQTNYSTITVSLSEEPVIKVGGKVFRPGTTVKEAAQAVVSLAQWLVEAIIWIVIVGAGIGVPLALIGWLGWKGVKRLRKK